MNLGLKMDRAYSEKLDRIVTADVVTKKNKNELLLKCASKNCRVNITFTEEHYRSYGDAKVTVPSFFRLISEKNHPHNDECVFSTLGELKTLARKSNSMLKQLEDEKIEFRLQFLTENKRNKKTSNEEDKDPSGNGAKGNKKNSVVSKGEKEAYLSTVQKILALKSKLDGDEELKETIVIKKGRSKVNWEDFYIETDDYHDLYEKIDKTNVNHPICVEGDIKRFHFRNESGYKSGAIELRRPSEKRTDGVPSVFINFKGDVIYDEMKRNQNKKHVAAYCEDFSTKERKEEGTTYLNIPLNINHKNQIHLWS